MAKLWGKLSEHSDSELQHARSVLRRFNTEKTRDDLAAVEAELGARESADDQEMGR